MTLTSRPSTTLFALAALLAALGLARPASADSGAYIGGSVGQAGLDLDGFIDDDDTAYKVFGGYNFDVTFINLAVEGSYTEFGTFRDSFQTSITPLEYDVNALSGFGVAGLDLGFFGLFAKAGVTAWNADSRFTTSGRTDDDGFDPAYGIGARLTFGSIEVRAEYEYFDIDIDGISGSDLSMASVGAAWTF